MRQRLVTAVLAFAVCWGIPELLVRIADPPLQQYRDVALARAHAAGEAEPQSIYPIYLDWCHPMPAGHRLIADALLAQLQPAN